MNYYIITLIKQKKKTLTLSAALGPFNQMVWPIFTESKRLLNGAQHAVSEREETYLISLSVLCIWAH